MAVHGFNREGARRVARAVRKSERQPSRSGGKNRSGLERTPPFIIEIIGEDPDEAGKYSWKKLVPENGALIDTADPLIDSAGEFTAREFNGAPGLTGRFEVQFVGYDGEEPPKPCYLFPNTTANGFYIRVVSSTPIAGAFNRWSYAWVEQLVNKVGTFKDRPAGQTSATSGIPAYNSMEANNAETGIQGNGIDIANLPAGWTIKPIGIGAVVWARVERNCDGDQELYFGAPNAVDGACA